MDHLGSAREWDLARKKGGLYILPPFGNVESTLYRGRIEAIYGAMNFITHSAAKYVVLTDCDVITNIDYKPIVAKHIETGADITVVSHTGPYTSEDLKTATVLNTNDEGQVTSVLIQPELSGTCTCSLNMFVMSMEFIVDMIKDSIARGKVSFEKDILQERCNELKIMAYEYKYYFSKLNSTDTYFKANMDILDPENAKYDLDSIVKNSLVADGCIIEGEVENCVLFRGVKVGKGAKIKNCILGQGTVVGDGAQMNYVITDKDVTVAPKHVLTSTADYQMYVSKGATV